MEIVFLVICCYESGACSFSLCYVGGGHVKRYYVGVGHVRRVDENRRKIVV